MILLFTKKTSLFLLLMFSFVLLHTSCSEEDEGYKGKILVTINTSSELWSATDKYPQVGQTLASNNYGGRFMYPDVGGDGATLCFYDSTNDDLADKVIASGDLGDRINIVYLFGTLVENADGYFDSKNQPVLYKGTSSINNDTITISKIAPGDYYVVAFYDYNTGGNQENLLNRYDRYSFYDTGSPDIGSPYVDEADTITITEETPVEITLTIHENWVIGKPNTDGGTGRIFLESSDGYPEPNPKGCVY